MKQKFINILEQRFVYLKDQKVLIGVSGGADSVFLLYLLDQVKKVFNIQLYVVHINYHLRGKESDKDEEFVTKLCEKMKLEFFVKNVKLDKESGVEEKARNIRYKIFEDICRKHDMKFCVSAHNADDDIESILMFILRGTGLRGLVGIDYERSLRKESKILLIRPILDFYKKDIEKYLFQKNIKYRRDSSNLLNKYARNRIRNKLMPNILKINKKAKEHILNLKVIAAENNELVKDLLKDKILDVLIQQNKDNIVIDFTRYMVYNKRIKKAILIHFLKDKANFIHINKVFEKLSTSNVGSFTLDLKNNFMFCKEREKLIIKKRVSSLF